MQPKHLRLYVKMFVATVITIGGYALFQAWIHNFHEVIPGELYRSGQFTESDIQKYAHKHGIRSIINLRGDNTGQEWYDDEVRDAKAAGIKHLNFRMSSKQVLTSAELIQLIRMMERAPKPVLIHCNGGANRTSFAVAVYLAAIKKADERTAEAQMSIRFGNFPEWMGSRSKMSYNFEMIEAMLGYEGS